MAAAMQMPMRSYQHFEAGRGRLNLDTLFAFAKATQSDPIALLNAVLLREPTLAVRCADNGLAAAMMLALERFNGASGALIPKLRSHAIVKVFQDAFDALEKEASRPDPTAEWIAELLDGKHRTDDGSAPPSE